MKNSRLIFLFVIIFIFLSSTFISGYLKSLPQPPTNFLILGLDPRNDSLEKTETTDTIIYAKLDPASATIKLVSLPRDLWFYPLSVKINHLYPLSLDQSSSNDFLKSNFSLIFGQPIDRLIVITTQNLSDIINQIGGVDVFLEKGFIDSEYPNPEYIKNPTPAVSPYITVEFPAGINRITSDNVSPFVRSRKSSSSAADGGTDLGRIQRQQLLLEALFKKFQSLKSNPTLLLNLYRYYQSNIKTDITQNDIFTLGFKLLPHLNSLKLVKISIPIGEDSKTDIIYDPKKLVNRQWVFLPQDSDYQSLKAFIRDNLN